jgi:tRNA threonylcarbamoyladenosine biosynthesis protein TsaE
MEKVKRYHQGGLAISKPGSTTLITRSPKETETVGARIARSLKAGDLLALTGDLGAGKTTFTKGIARGLGIAHAEYVNSPSFVLIREYKGKRLDLFHFDLYRLDNLYDIEYIGPEEYMDRDGVVVIEWAGKLDSLLPAEYLNISIYIIDDKKRKFVFDPHGKRYDNIVSRYLK